MAVTIQFRRGTAAAATSNNAILGAGEPGFETDTGKFKIGDGSTPWNSLPYANGKHFRGAYTSLANLQSSVPVGDIGDYAYVDTGVGSNVSLYIWDDNDEEWILSGAGVGDEVTSNKVTNLSSISSTLYPSTSAFFGTREITGTDSLEQADNGKTVYLNSATNFNLTIDELDENSYVNLINIGAGTVTLVNGAGVTYSGESEIRESGNALVVYHSATAPLVFTSDISLDSITGLGSGVATWLATPSWTNFNAAVSGTAPYVPLTGTAALTGNVELTGAYKFGLSNAGSAFGVGVAPGSIPATATLHSNGAALIGPYYADITGADNQLYVQGNGKAYPVAVYNGTTQLFLLESNGSLYTPGAQLSSDNNVGSFLSGGVGVNAYGFQLRGKANAVHASAVNYSFFQLTGGDSGEFSSANTYKQVEIIPNFDNSSMNVIGIDYNAYNVGSLTSHIGLRLATGNLLVGASSITANTKFDLRGNGTTTDNILRAANSANTLRLALTDAGNLYGTAGSTGMTDGFFYIPSAAGAPSGTPTVYSNRVPMYYDTTNDHYYIYNGAWKKVLLA